MLGLFSVLVQDQKTSILFTHCFWLFSLMSKSGKTPGCESPVLTVVSELGGTDPCHQNSDFGVMFQSTGEHLCTQNPRSQHPGQPLTCHILGANCQAIAKGWQHLTPMKIFNTKEPCDQNSLVADGCSSAEVIGWPHTCKTRDRLGVTALLALFLRLSLNLYTQG